MGDQNKKFAPHRICMQCYGGLSYWANGKEHGKKFFQFNWPMSWREPKSHGEDCYFCTNDAKFNSKRRKKELKAVPSVIITERDGSRIPLLFENGE